jgi:hypothetical protein
MSAHSKECRSFFVHSQVIEKCNLRVETVAGSHHMISSLQKGFVTRGSTRSNLVNPKHSTHRERGLNVFRSIDRVKHGYIITHGKCIITLFSHEMRQKQNKNVSVELLEKMLPVSFSFFASVHHGKAY